MVLRAAPDKLVQAAASRGRSHLRQFHSDAITDAAAIPAVAGAVNPSNVTATCSLDGRVELWSCGADGSLASTAVLDVRALMTPPAPVKLLCLAASADGKFLAAGDNTGRVHIISLSPTAGGVAPTKLATHAAHDTDITCLSFEGSCMGAPSSPNAGCLPLLATASNRGQVKLLQANEDGSCSVVALLADHKYAVTGIQLGAGGAWLATVNRAGRRVLYRADTSTGQLQLAVQATLPRCSFVGLLPGLWGQEVVAASRAGRVYTWDSSGKEVGSLQALDLKSHGELTSFAVDGSLTLLACATNRNQLLVFNMLTGKLAAACKAHIGGTAIKQVLIAPDSRTILCVGEDAAVLTFHLPASLINLCREAPQRLNPQGEAQQAAPAISGASSSTSACVQPRHKRGEATTCKPLITGDAAGPQEEAASELLMPPAITAITPTAEELTAAAPVCTIPQSPAAGAAGLRRTASIPPSPSRQAAPGAAKQMQGQLAELEEQFRQMKSTRQQPTAGPAPPPAAEAAGCSAGTPTVSRATPWTAAAAAAGGGAVSPVIDFGSPLEMLSSISTSALCSPEAALSPDVFAYLPSPAPDQAAGPGACSPLLPPSLSTFLGAGSGMQHDDATSAAERPAVSPSASAVPAVPAAPVASPAGPTSAGSSKLRRLAQSMGWRSVSKRSWARHSPSNVVRTATSQAAKQHSIQADALDAADAERCRALLNLTDSQEAGGQAAVPITEGAPCAPDMPVSGAAHTPLAAPGTSSGSPSCTVDLMEALGEAAARCSQGSSLSVNQPRRRRSWGPVPSSEPRRALSALASSTSETAENDEALAQRPYSALGIEEQGDEFLCFRDSSAKGTPATAQGSGGSCPGSVTSRRLSFSFGATKQCAAGPATTSQDEADTPTMPVARAQPAASDAAQHPAFSLPTYCSPGLAAPGQLPATSATSEDSTPRLFLQPAKRRHEAVGSRLAPPSTSEAVPAAAAADALEKAVPGTASSAAAGPAPKPRGLQGRPPVPRLNLAGCAALLSGSAAPIPTAKPVQAVPAPAPAAAAKRSWEEASSPAESSGSTNGSTGGDSPLSGISMPGPPATQHLPEEVEQGAAEECSPASKKSKPAYDLSPPRLVINCQLYEYSAEKARPASTDPGTADSWRSKDSFWPVAAGSCGAASSVTAAPFDPDDLFGKPAAYDPLAEEEEAAAPPRRPASLPHATYRGPASSFGLRPPSSNHNSSAKPPSTASGSVSACDKAAAADPTDAEAASSSGTAAATHSGASASASMGTGRPAGSPLSMPEKTPAMALCLMRRGLKALTDLQEGTGSSAKIDAAFKRQLASFAAELQQVASSLAPGSGSGEENSCANPAAGKTAAAAAGAGTPSSRPAPSQAGQDSVASVSTADLKASLKAELMAELLPELLRQLRR